MKFIFFAIPTNYFLSFAQYKLGKHRSNGLELIQKVPPIEVEGDIAVCDGGGGALGHPLEYIKVGSRGGEPVSCISQLRRDNEFTVISDDILVYEVGNIVYVNQPYGGCNGAEHNAVINKRTTSQLCSGEILEVRNLQIGATYGSCALGKFTPYRKIDSSAD